MRILAWAFGKICWDRMGLAAVFLLSLILLPASRLDAAISDCIEAREAVPGVGPGDTVFKLILDELAGAPTTGDAMIMHRALLSKLQDNFDKAQLELGRFHVVLCLGRSPVQVHDIMQYVEGFADHDVVLETWGYFDLDEVTLVHAFLPLLASRSQTWRPGINHVSTTYAYDGTGELKFLKKLVNTSPEIRIFASLGAASAAYADKDFDNARTYSCRTLLLLTKYQENTLTWLDPNLVQEMEGFLRDMSLRVLDDAALAREAGAYDGPLGSPNVPSGTTCEGVRAMTRHRARHAWAFLCLSSVALLAICAKPPGAEAGVIAPCFEPIIFPGADVNLVLLPYALNSPEIRLRPDSFALWESEGARALSSLNSV